MSNAKSHLPLAILLVSCGIRAIHGILKIEMIYPDEHFQTIEPANWVVNGYGLLAWEYTWGARTWMTPALYMPVIKVMQWFGDTGSPMLVSICRSWTGLWNGFVALILFQLMSLHQRSQTSAMLAALVYALMPTFVLFGAATFQETWTTTFVWILILAVCRNAESRSTDIKSWSLIGLASGLLFGIRFQSLAWTGPLFLTWCVLYRPRLKFAASAMAAGLIGILLVGLLDLLTWGSWFHTIKTYYQVNFVQNFLGQFGTSPWYDYVSQSIVSFGQPIAWIVGLLLVVFALSAKQWQRMDLLILIPAVCFVAFHSSIGHKELRFITPAYPALAYICGHALGSIWQACSDRIPWRLPSSVLALGLAALFYLSLAAAGANRHYLSADVSRLQSTIRLLIQDGSRPTNCILMYGVDWSWTRFDMIIGSSVPRKVLDMNQLSSLSPELQECRFALVSPDRNTQFMRFAGDRFEESDSNWRGDRLYVAKP